jgi:S1-C subfamily serine protease
VPGKIPIAIGGDQTMVLPPTTPAPLAPNGAGGALRHARDVEASTWTRAKKWWLIGGGAALAVILIVGIYLLASRSNTNVTPATPPGAFDAVPLPFRDSLPSVVSLSVRDAEGRALRQASGFFFKADEIVTSVSAIEGATQGRVTFVGQNGAYEISGVTGMDRERGIVTLKVARARAPALSIGGRKQTTMGERVAAIGSGARTEAAYAPGLINSYLDDDRMEVGAQTPPTIVGGPLLNAQGEVIGILTESTGGRALAVPINYLADLIRRRSQAMTLAVAGAKDILFDWRKSEPRPAPPAMAKDLEHKIIGLVARAHREKAQPQPTPGASPSATAPAQTGGQGAADDTSLPLWGEMSGATITGVAEGSFTTAGAKQTAYLIDTHSGSPAEQGGPKYLAIFSGDTLVADFPVPGLSLVLQTFDLNRDGINELLLGYHHTQAGEVLEWAKLVQVTQGRLRIIKDFETTYRSTCGSEAATDKAIEASAIFYPPTAANGQMPDFRVDNFRAACPPEGIEVGADQWKYTSTGKLQDK